MATGDYLRRAPTPGQFLLEPRPLIVMEPADLQVVRLVHAASVRSMAPYAHYMRLSGLRSAVRFCAATVTWNVAVGGAAVATAIASGSLSLIGFGVNAVVDSSVSALLVWRFRAEQAGYAARAVRWERVALRLAGAAFSVIAIYVLARAVAALAGDHRPSSSLFGV